MSPSFVAFVLLQKQGLKFPLYMLLEGPKMSWYGSSKMGFGNVQVYRLIRR